jgi:hypothetical protein
MTQGCARLLAGGCCLGNLWFDIRSIRVQNENVMDRFEWIQDLTP